MNGTLYFECESGISGDMAVAAMLDLGADRDALMRALDSLDVDGFDISIKDVMKSGIRAKDFDVILDEDNHDHDAEYLYGHHHEEGHHHHHHSHRHYGDIVALIEKADMTERARFISLRILRILGEAESEAHGVPLEEVHFHEVGAVDSIVDIVSLGVCLDSLDPDGVCFSELYEGTGTVVVDSKDQAGAGAGLFRTLIPGHTQGGVCFYCAGLRSPPRRGTARDPDPSPSRR